ncbi:hypothetical protein FQN57_003349 [Myotisia sp. PD_48]|nr:hypothetical protein FQN57_003349 [Myotisia sp. PD_48]
MVAIKSILSIALLAVTAIAGPIEQRDEKLRCKNSELSRDENTLTESNARRQLGASPIHTGRSGYPHAFMNFQGIKFSKKCRNRDLVEYPVFKDKSMVYNFDSNPKDNPGPFRVIATADSRLYCGVISHDGGNGNPNAGNFHKCE